MTHPEQVLRLLTTQQRTLPDIKRELNISSSHAASILKRLIDAKQIARKGVRRKYLYGLPGSPETNATGEGGAKVVWPGSIGA